MATGTLPRLHRRINAWAVYRRRVSAKSKLLIIGVYGVLIAYSPLHHWRLWDLSLIALIYGRYRLRTPPDNRMMDSMRVEEASEKMVVWQVIKHNLFTLNTTERPRIGQLLAFSIPAYLAAKLYSSELHGYWDAIYPWLMRHLGAWI